MTHCFDDTSASNTTWGQWCYMTDTGTSSTVSGNAVWYKWNTTSGSTTATTLDYTPIWVPWVVKQEETAEARSARLERERVEREAEQERYRKQQEQWRKLEAERAEAEAKAKKLLEAHLDEEQKEEVKKHNYFTVMSRDSQRRYRIKVNQGVSGNIEEIDAQGKAITRLCCHPKESLPQSDSFLTQMLWLMWNEEGFRKTANLTDLCRAA